jgi:hypothetical protein
MKVITTSLVSLLLFAAAQTAHAGPYAAEAKQWGVDEAIVQASHTIFPWMSQERQRLEWILGQRQRAERNKTASQ